MHAAEQRLALKAIYQSEFNYPIDEPPFLEILPTGERRNHLYGECGGWTPETARVE